MSSLNKALLYF